MDDPAHTSDQADSDPSICAHCLKPLRTGAVFCSHCGREVSAATQPDESFAPAQAGTPFAAPTTFAEHWEEIKQGAWLFGLLLFTSFFSGMISRATTSPWVDVAASGVDALIVLEFANLRSREILPLLRVPRFDARAWAVLGGLSIAFVMIMTAYFSFIEYIGIPMLKVTDSLREAGWSIGAILVLVSLTPAVVEEVAFRGVLQSVLARVLGRREAWIIQAALFSVIHLLPIAFPSHFAMGLCLGYMRLRSGSLYPGMSLHAAWNALVVYDEIYTL